MSPGFAGAETLKTPTPNIRIIAHRIHPPSDALRAGDLTAMGSRIGFVAFFSRCALLYLLKTLETKTNWLSRQKRVHGSFHNELTSAALLRKKQQVKQEQTVSRRSGRRLRAYLCLSSVPRSRNGRKCLRISTANRCQRLSVYDWDAAKALRVARFLLTSSSIRGVWEGGSAVQLKDGGHFDVSNCF